MSIWQVFKVSRRTFFNPRAWLNYDNIIEGNRAIWQSMRSLFAVRSPRRTETFNQAIERLKLTEEDIKQTEARYIAYVVVFVFFAIISMLFSLYLLFFHISFSGFLIGLATTGLFGSQAFRFHFWYFQIKHRKLGCTFDEWWQGHPFKRGKPHD